MTKYTINGGYVLRGEVMICGAKNAVLPVLSATLINKGVSRIINCPDISDVRITMDILKDLGCKVKFIKKCPGNIIEVDATEVNKSKIDAGKACLCRSSVTFLGALTARLKEAEVAYPGGCTIGERPIDIHETAMREMGIETTLNNTHIKTKVYRNDCNTEPIKNIYLKFPSVGATENAMMAAAGLEENVIIYGAATEPEILCLGNYLKALGVKIQGLGTGCIKIKGQKEYSKENLIFKIIPDRIEASTYFIMAAAIGDGISVHGCCSEHCKETLKILRTMGCNIKEHKYKYDGQEQSVIEISDGAIRKKLKSPGVIIADAYPSFPTDAQSLILPLLAVADGEAYVIDKIFPKRFKAAEELIKTGAKIKYTDFGIHITGRNHLKGNILYSYDLRGGASMIIAGLLAHGQTSVYDEDYIKRGYEGLTEKIRALGGNITESHVDP